MTAQERPAGRCPGDDVPRPAGAPLTREELVEQLVPLATELVGTVRDYGPDDVAAVLARVPDGRHDALAIVLAAMVDPDIRPSKLLAWLDEPVPSRERWEPRHLQVQAVNANSLGRRPERRAEIERLAALGLSTSEIAARMGLTTRSIGRHRAALRAGQSPTTTRRTA